MAIEVINVTTSPQEPHFWEMAGLPQILTHAERSSHEAQRGWWCSSANCGPPAQQAKTSIKDYPLYIQGHLHTERRSIFQKSNTAEGTCLVFWLISPLIVDVDKSSLNFVKAFHLTHPYENGSSALMKPKEMAIGASIV